MSVLRMVAGDDRVVSFNITDTEGAPLDLSGYEVTFAVRNRSWRSPFVVKSIGSGIELGVGVGDVLVSLDSADTAGLPNPTGYLWALKVTDAEGDTHTVGRGRLIVE